MSKKKLDAADIVDIIDSKMNFIINIVLYTNFEGCCFNEKDMEGFRMILGDLHEEIQEVKKLM